MADRKAENSAGSRKWRVSPLLMRMLVCLIIVMDANATRSAQNSGQRSILQKPYCGVCCVYATIRLSNREIDFVDLLKTKYIGSSKGSSLAELAEAAREYGLFAEPVEKLTSRSLRDCPHHVILHVKCSLMDRQYDHYVLFLGTSNGQARLFDAPDQVKVIPFSELAPRWNGSGLIVSTHPVDLSRVFAASRKQFLLWTATIVGAVLMIRWTRRWVPISFLERGRAFSRLPLSQAVGLALGTLVCGALYHVACDEGLLANAHATTSIQEAHAGNFLPRVHYPAVRRLLANGAVLIDARYRYDYGRGHIDGALNVPTDANDQERQEITVAIPKASKVVVYCQSKGCQFAEKIALRLQDDGFSNVVVYRGGWVDWVARNGKKNAEGKS